MSVAKTNHKLVEQLRTELDLRAVATALDRGEITPRQAQNLTRWIRAVEKIQENYKYTRVVQDPTSGQYVGAVVSRNRGKSWIGLRYGPNYPHNSAEFTAEQDAVRFVGQQ
jgi:hypothetical protein